MRWPGEVRIATLPPGTGFSFYGYAGHGDRRSTVTGVVEGVGGEGGIVVRLRAPCGERYSCKRRQDGSRKATADDVVEWSGSIYVVPVVPEDAPVLV